MKLHSICDGQFCHGEELARVWSLVGNWAAAYLDAHPRASGPDLVASLAELAPLRTRGLQGDEVTELRGDAVELTASVFALSVSYGEMGTFFVIAPDDDGKFRVQWSINNFAGFPAADAELACWNVDAACGPLFGSVFPLPSTASGRPRFYVEALYAGNGSTVGAQMSVWEWTGAAAVPLAAGKYAVMIDDDRHVQFDGEYLTIPTKEEARSFFTCGACVDPAGTWTLHITPAGVEDLGHRWQNPELELVDRVLDGVKAGKRVEDIAAPSVVEKLKPIALETHGMLMSWSVNHRSYDAIVSITIDDETLRFTLVQYRHHPYVIAVEVDQASSSTGPREHSANPPLQAPATTWTFGRIEGPRFGGRA